MDLAHRRLTPDFTLYVSGGGRNCVSCDICVYHLRLFVFFPGVFLSSRATGACPVTMDMIMRVNVRTTTTHADIHDVVLSYLHSIYGTGYSIMLICIRKDDQIFVT